MDAEVAALVERFGLQPLPVEGTFFRNTYISATRLADGGPAGTAGIGLYCAEPPSRSLFHRLTADEVWHFYGGDPIRLMLLHPDGTSEDVLLGGDLQRGGCVQHVIPAGTWQAGELAEGGRWALFGCTMAPGFTGTCFEGGHIDALLASHPARRGDIERLGVPRGHATSMPGGYQQ